MGLRGMKMRKLRVNKCRKRILNEIFNQNLLLKQNKQLSDSIFEYLKRNSPHSYHGRDIANTFHIDEDFAHKLLANLVRKGTRIFAGSGYWYM